MESESFFTHIFSEDVMLRMCLFLPGRALLDLGATCQTLRPCTNDGPMVWRSLCVSLLGEALVHLHQEAWAGTAAILKGIHSVEFFRELFQSAYASESFAYSLKIRHECMHGAPASDSSTSSTEVVLREKSQIDAALAVSGPTSNTVGHLVVNIGGSRSDGRATHQHLADEELTVCVIDLKRKQVVRPRLTAGSARPRRRTRHAACVINPRWASECTVQSGLRPLLVLGGCNDVTAEPCGGLQDLLLLEFTKDDGSEIQWRDVQAEGQGPRGIWHHVCGAFAQGKKVVVYGGDMLRSDAEFEHIDNRETASHVYVLQVDTCVWERVATSGIAPIWRSLHKGVTYNSLADASERLVIVGGSVDHVPLHRQGELADMVGYSLHLGSFVWSRGPTVGTEAGGHGLIEADADMVNNHALLPSPRMRFAADRYGRFLIIYSGVDEMGQLAEDQQMLKMNLLTLEWSRVQVMNNPHSFPNLPGAALSNGVLTGGWRFSPFVGVSLVPKLDFLCLLPPSTVNEVPFEHVELSDQESSDDEDEMGMVNIEFRSPDGEVVVRQMPRAVFMQMVQLGALHPRQDG